MMCLMRPMRSAVSRVCGHSLVLLLGLCLLGCGVFKRKSKGEDTWDEGAKGAAAMRLASFVLRDASPSAAEARAFHEGKSSYASLIATWRTSPAHRERVRRYFTELVGVRTEVLAVFPSYLLKKNAEGAYYLAAKTACETGEAVETEAWWATGKVLMCADSQSDALRYGGASDLAVCSRVSADGLLDPRCGCGPKQVLCLPEEAAPKSYQALRGEIGARGLYAYENRLPWSEFLDGNAFWGNRYLYHIYVLTQGGILWGDSPDATTLKTLQSIPIATPARAAFPAGPSRAGILTSPAFLQQYNTFRSRVRGIAERLLCTDVGPQLAPDNIKSFVNPSLTAADRAHGAKAACASCHYAMDNIGSAFLPWSPLGFNLSHASYNSISTRAHAFGQAGEGVAFVGKAIRERSNLFNACMAKRAWEGFAMGVWEKLPPASQAAFADASAHGPRALIDAIIDSNELRAARDGVR